MEVFQVNGVAYEANAYLVMCKKTILVDVGTGQGKFFKQMLSSIKEHVEPQSLDKIILTHNHFDHAGGVPKLCKLVDTKIYVHALDRDALVRGDNVVTGARAWGGNQEPIETRVLGESMDLGDVKLKVLHTPGHTPGSISLYERESKSLFCGDLIFANGGFGRYDLIGGDKGALYKSIRIIAGLEVERLYPGHGEWIERDGKKHVNLALREATRWLS